MGCQKDVFSHILHILITRISTLAFVTPYLPKETDMDLRLAPVYRSSPVTSFLMKYLFCGNFCKIGFFCYLCKLFISQRREMYIFFVNSRDDDHEFDIS